MTQTLKNTLIKVLAVAALVAVPLLVPAVVGAQPSIQDSLCEGSSLQVGSGGTCADTEGDTEINSIIETVINIFSLVVGVVAVIMIIIGGLKYITSSGDSNNITSAKNTILYAIIGLVIVAMAQFIVRFVLGKASGA